MIFGTLYARTHGRALVSSRLVCFWVFLFEVLLDAHEGSKKAILCTTDLSMYTLWLPIPVSVSASNITLCVLSWCYLICEIVK